MPLTPLETGQTRSCEGKLEPSYRHVMTHVFHFWSKNLPLQTPRPGSEIHVGAAGHTLGQQRLF